MEDFIKYTILFDFYGELLTDKQQKYFKEYYFDNLSLKEISLNYQVSRNAIFNQIKETKELLNHYEKILHLKEKQEKLELICQKIKEEEIKKEIREIIES